MSVPDLQWTRRQLWLALGCVALAWALAFALWPALGLVVPWDSKTQFYAFFRFLGRAATEGSSPLWNPYHYMGHPSVADPQSLVFQPAFRLLALVAPDAPIAVFDLVVAGHLLVGMAGMAMLGRHLGWHPIATVLAAIVFAFGGSASARLSHTGIILGYGLMPLALFLLWRAIDRGSWVAGLGFALVASLVALGRDQVAILSCLVLVAAALARLAGTRAWVSRLPLLAAIGVVGVALLATPMPPARFAFGLAIASALYALGWFTPLYKLLYDVVPGVALFRRPADATFVLNLAVALATGAFASHVAAQGRPRIGVPGRNVALGLGLAAMAGANWFASHAGEEAHAAGQLGIAAALMAACGLALKATRDRRARVGLLTLLVALTWGELVWRNMANSLNAEPAINYAVLERPTGAIADALTILDADLARAHAAGERPRIEILGLGGAAQNLAMVRGLEAINGYNPLRLAQVDRLIRPGQNNHEVGQRVFPASFESWTAPLAREVGLGWLLLGTRLHKIPSARDIADAALLTETRGTRLYRLADALPRARLAGPGRAVVTAFRPDRIVVAVDAGAPTTLVMADPFYPGWVARMGRAEVAIATSNGLDRRVEVPAGRSEVVFGFEPLAPANLARIARGLAGR